MKQTATPSMSVRLWISFVAMLVANSMLYLMQTHSHPVEGIHNKLAGDLPVVQSPTTAIDNTGTTSAPSTGKKQYNIMIFYPDDWRHDTIGAAGTQPVLTPFLDQLARDGIRFTQNAVTTSICWISRATKLTGQYLSRHQSTFLKTPLFYDRWNETFPYLLQQQAGYFVGHIGKWQYRNPDSLVQSLYNWTSLYEGSHWYNIKKTQVHSTTRDQEESIRFLRERPRDVPFCLTTAFYAPKAVGDSMEDQYFPMNTSAHLYEGVDIPLPQLDPEAAFRKMPPFMQENWYYLEGRRRYVQRYDTNVTGQYQRFMTKYYRMVSEVDAAIERVVEELKEQGILDETIIIFTTDNGLFHGEHGLAGKWFPHQESIRVPLIIRDPRMAVSQIGTTDDSFTLNIDLAPTILGAAGLTAPSAMQGRDIADLYLQSNAKETWRKEFFYEYPKIQSKKSIPESSALVRKDFKYMRWPQFNNYEQLFNLHKDPFEHEDLAQQPEVSDVLQEMRTKHDELKGSIK